MSCRPRYLMLLLTTACNLNCLYCYRGDKDRPQSMPREVALKSFLLAAAAGRPFHVQLTGGEPTLEPELIEWVADTIRKAGWPATIALQTNGTLLDYSLIRVCQKYDIQIGVSWDGPPEIQEKLRGKAVATLKGLKLLSAAGMPFRVTTVVTQVNVAYLGRLALFLSAFPSARGLGLDLLVQKGQALKAPPVTPPTPETLRTGLFELLDTLRRVKARRSSPLHWREWELLQQSHNRRKAAPFCPASRGESLAVHPQGTLYPCTQTVGDRRFASGTLDAPDPSGLLALKKYTLNGTACSGCPLVNHCPGDCPSRQYYNQEPARRLACVMYQTIDEYERRCR